MDIVVHGTKGGRKIFTHQKISGLLDVTADGAKATAIGQQAYGIRFTAGNTIFSKYKIIRDVRGDKRTGFVGFSLSIPNNKKLSGTEIITVLDKVSDEYSQTYIVDNNLNEVTENWAFINSISNEYKTKLLDVSADDMQSGDKGDAFVYFKDTAELQKYFDAPYQDEYTPYRQILFVDNALKDKPENPLNALRHDPNANLTGKIDLENKYYYLNSYNNSKGVKISAYYNNKWNDRFDKKGANQIRAKWTVKIEYSKNDRCYDPITAKGTISDLYKYLEIKDNQIMLKYDVFSNPKPKIKSVTFEIKDRNGKGIEGAEITYQTGYQQEQKTTDNTIHFTGEEIIKSWTVSARKGDNLFSDSQTIIPGNQIGDVTLVLEEHKIIEFQVENENKQILSDYRVSVQNRNENIKIIDNVKIEFVGNTIEKDCTVDISCYGYKTEILPNIYPKSQKEPIPVTLKKDTRGTTRYFIDKGAYGEKKEGTPDYVESKDGADPRWIKPKKGYKCIGFKLDKDLKEKGYAGVLVARYEKQKSVFANLLNHPVLFAFSLIAVITIVVVVAYWDSIFSGQSPKPQQELISEQIISSYVEGDSLMSETLNTYKDDWTKQKPEVKTTGGRVWYNPMTLFVGSDSAKSDSTEYKKWYEIMQSIEQAIEKRKSIDSLNFAELKKLNFSKQSAFQTAIEKIDSTKYDDVKQRLGKVSDLTLTQIADSIIAILTQQPVETKSVQGEKRGNLQSTKSAEQPTDKTSGIIQYIKGDELNPETLQSYKKEVSNEALKKSIDLCLEFWKLDGSEKKTYSSFKQKIDKDLHLKDNSELKHFLDKMCDKGQTPKPKYWDNIIGNETNKKTLKYIASQNEINKN